MATDEALRPDPNYVEPPLPPITMDDLITSTQFILKKEADDKLVLEGISNIPQSQLKDKLLEWAIAGFPNVYEIYKIVITPPTICSDGIVRNLPDYIVFCSGKPIYDHVSALQQKVTGISISFANMGTHISIVASKA